MKTWQIVALVLLVVLGGLFILPFFGGLMYFGALSPGELLPERCLVSAEFGCTDYGVSDTELFVQLKNQYGASLVIEEFTPQAEGVVFGDCSVPVELANDAETRISCPIQSGSFSDRARIDVSISYLPRGSSFSPQASMDLFISK